MSKNVEISSDDKQTFIAIWNKLAMNIMESYSGDAEAALLRNTTLKDSFKMVASRFLCKFNENSASPEKYVRALTGFLNASLPPLKRAFGEAGVLKALPEEAKNERVIAICEQLGRNNLANICRQALENKP